MFVTYRVALNLFQRLVEEIAKEFLLFMSDSLFLVKDGSMVFRNNLSTFLENQLGLRQGGSAFDSKLAAKQLADQPCKFVFWTISKDEPPPSQVLLRQHSEAQWFFLTSGSVDVAFASIPKLQRPNHRDQGSLEAFAQELRKCLKALATNPKPKLNVTMPPLEGGRNPVLTMGLLKHGIFIGSSTGGPNALMNLLPLLHMENPIFIAQHMPPKFTQSLAKSLSDVTGKLVQEAEDLEIVRPGRVYIAPGGWHMEVMKNDARQWVTHVNRNRPVNGCRPSVDILFESAAKVYQDKAIAVILTGMGEDGLQGTKFLKQQGATIFAQDEASSVVWGMPGAVTRAGLVHKTGNLKQLAQFIADSLQERMAMK